MADDTTAETRLEEPRRAPHGAPFAPSGEWLFQRGGQVFGPLGGTKLVALLAKGELAVSTQVRREGEAWRSLSEVAELRGAIEEMQARARVEAARAAERARERRRAALRWASAALGFGVVVVLVAAVAAFLAVKRPWEKRSALLDDFGVPLTIGPGRVALSPLHSADEEIAVPDETASSRPSDRGRAEARSLRAGSAGGGARATGAAGVGAGASGLTHAGPAVGGGDLVLTQYDPGRIEATVARSKETLAPCVRDEASRSPDFVGEIPIEFAIGNDGKVSALWVNEPRFKSGELRDCLRARLREWSFDPFPGQRPVVSLTFRLGR